MSVLCLSWTLQWNDHKSGSFISCAQGVTQDSLRSWCRHSLNTESINKQWKAFTESSLHGLEQTLLTSSVPTGAFYLLGNKHSRNSPQPKTRGASTYVNTSSLLTPQKWWLSGFQNSPARFSSSSRSLDKPEVSKHWQLIWKQTFCWLPCPPCIITHLGVPFTSQMDDLNLSLCFRVCFWRKHRLHNNPHLYFKIKKKKSQPKRGKKDITFFQVVWKVYYWLKWAHHLLWLQVVRDYRAGAAAIHVFPTVWCLKFCCRANLFHEKKCY